METCSVCGKKFDYEKLKPLEKEGLKKGLANAPRYFALIDFPDGLQPFVTGTYCSVKCMKDKLKEEKTK